jgi:KDO2-lipid IV(A) lauroyltransferase
MKKISAIKQLRNYIIYIFILLLIKFIQLWPRRTAIKITQGIGQLSFRLAFKSKRRIKQHLTKAFGQEKSSEEIKKLTKDVFMHSFTAAADYVRLPIMTSDEINNIIKVDGIEHLEKAYAKNRGVIMLSAHLGNWELLGVWVAKQGFPSMAVGARIRNPHLGKLVIKFRRQCGLKNIKRGNDTREIIKALKQGQGVGMLIDQSTKVQGEFVNFFGFPAHTATAPYRLAKKYGSPIIPIFIHLHKDYTYHIECLEEIKLHHSGDDHQDIIDTLQDCSTVIEGFVRKHPEQWSWIHRRWKKQPDFQKTAS